MEADVRRLEQAYLKAQPAPRSMASPSLCGTLWKLQALQDSSGPALIEPPGRPAELLLAVDQERVSGTGGCNRLIGGFPLAGEELSHSRFASTQMACLPEVMAIERRYSEAPRSGSALERRQTQPASPMIAEWDETRAGVVKDDLINNYADIMAELRNNLNSIG